MTKSIDLVVHFTVFTSKIYEISLINNLQNTDSLYYIIIQSLQFENIQGILMC